MLWIYALAILMPIDIGLCASVDGSVSGVTATAPVNLTVITWDHAVNSQFKLKNALANNLKMIEADVFVGRLILDKEVKLDQVIMAHGPDEVMSDLSLEDFLNQINEYNKDKRADTVKGIKLDFKSTDAFTKSQDLLKKIGDNYAAWLNADIVKGPVDSDVTPVNAAEFIRMAKQLKDSKKKFTWSVGWTTKWTEDGVTSGKYTEKDVDMMITTLGDQPDQPITFPVRAGLVATSQVEMKKLLDKYEGSTLTVWSGLSDEVNAPELQKFIKEIGIEKVYLDVPKILSNKLNLGSGDKPSKSSANKVAHIGLMSIVMLILTKLFL